MRKFRNIVIILSFLILMLPLQADDFNKGGRTVMQFTKIGLGARQVAMGEACITLEQDASSVFWNPSGIGRIKRSSSSFSYVNWFADMEYMAGSFALRLYPSGVFAMSLASLNYGDIPEATVGASSSAEARTGNTFTGSDFMLAGTYAHEFTDRLVIGISLKYLSETLFEYEADVFAVDVGSLYNTGFNNL